MVLVVHMWASNFIVGLLWLESRVTDVNWQQGQLLALLTPGGEDMVAVDWVHYPECPRNVQGCVAKEDVCSEAGSSILEIQNLRGTAVHDQLDIAQTLGTIFLTV